MKKKYVVLVVTFLLLCTCAIPVSGAMGTVRLSLPKEMNGEEIICYNEGEEYKTVAEDGVAILENVSPGDYKIYIPNTREYQFQDVEVRVPTWSDEEERMLYDITLEPKYQKNAKSSPLTGDDTPTIWFGVGCITAFAAGLGCIIVHVKKKR